MSSDKKISINNDQTLLSAKQASLRLKCAADYVGKLCRDGKLDGVQIEGAWFVSIPSVVAFEKSRAEAKKARSQKLSQERLQESALYKPVVLEETPEANDAAPQQPSLFAHSPLKTYATLSLGVAFLFAAVVFAGGTGSMSPLFGGAAQSASIAHVESPFFAGIPEATNGSATTGSFFGNVFAFLFGTRQPQVAASTPTQTVAAPVVRAAQPVVAAAPAATQSAPASQPAQTIIENKTYPVTERTVVQTQSGITQADLDAQLAALSDNLQSYVNSRIASAPSSNSYNGGGTITTNEALSQRIDSLSGITITGSAISGGTISGATITGGSITGVALSAGDLTGVVGIAQGGTGTSSAPTQGDLLVGNASGGYDLLHQGANGQVLKVLGGQLTWGFDTGGGGGGGAWATTTDNLAIYPADPSQVVLVGTSATTTTGNILEVAGNSLFRGQVTAYGTLTLPNFIATSSVASILPYASSTAITVSGTGFFGSASTSNLTVSGLGNSLLKTLSSGAVVAAVSGVDYQPAGSYATFGYLFPGNATSTPIAFNGGATISSLSLGTALTPANGGTGTSTAPNYGQLLLGNHAGGYDLVSTSSLGIISSSFGYLFPGNATSTQIAFNGGATFAGATTTALEIANLASTTFLTVSSLGGSGTSCVQADASGKLSTTGSACGSGSGAVNSVSNSDGTLTISPNTGAVFASLNLSHANTFTALQQFGAGASTTQLSAGVAYFGNTATSSFNGAGTLTLAGGFNGPLQAIGGVVSATSSIGVHYGGTGTTTVPAYGQLLVGNIFGGYDLISTSSLGIVSGGSGAFPFTPATFGSTASNATSTLIGFTAGLYSTASSTIQTLNTSNLTLSNLIADATGTTSITGNLIPTADNTYTLGSLSKTFKEVYIGPGSLFVNGQEVLHTDGSNNVVVSSSINQNLVLQTTGTANIELNPSGTGQLLIKSNINFTGGKSFTTSDSSAVLFPSGVAAGNITVSGSAITANLLNSGIAITPNGTGNTYITAGNFGIGTTSPTNKLEVNGASYLGGNVTITGNTNAQQATTTNLAITNVPSALLKTLSNGAVVAATPGTDYQAAGSYATFGYLFPNNATSTQLTLGGGFIAPASSTIGNGTQQGGLTVAGSATTTGNLQVNGSITVNGSLKLAGVTGSVQCLHVGANGIVSGTGSDCGTGGGGSGTFLGLSDVPASYVANQIYYTNSTADAVTASNNFTFDGTTLTAPTISASTLTVSGSSSFGTVIAGVWHGTPITDAFVNDALTINGGTINNSPIGATTPSTGVFTNATTTNLTAYNSAKFGGTATSSFANNGALTLAQALAIASGGTGTSTAPSYGQLLLGNVAGGYDLVSTSSLGIQAGVTSVSNSDGSLTISPTLGAVVASLNVSNANSWIGPQTFLNLFATNASSTNSTSSVAFITALTAANATTTNLSTANLAVTGLPNSLLATNANGLVVATSSLSLNYLTQASLTQSGYLSSIDFTSFNNKISSTSLSATYPLAYNSSTGLFTTAFSTTTANTFSALNTFNGGLSGNLTGNVTGNASTATALQTGRTINGVTFDGTSNITLFAASSTLLGDSNTFNGSNTFTSTIIGSISGNAATVTTNANLSGVVTSVGNTTSFGSFNSATLANALSDETGSGAAVFGSNATLTGTTLASTTFTGNVYLAAATTTNLAISGTANTLLKTLSNGAVVAAVAGVDYATPASLGAAYPFTTTTNYGTTVSATTTPLFAVNGLFASSTSHFTFADFASTSLGNATSTSFAITNIINGLLATNANGSVVATTSISTNLLSGTLGIANGGTGSTTLTGILVGSSTTNSVRSLIVGSGLTFDGTTLATNGAGITAVGPLGQTQTGGTQLLATSTNGTDFTITASGNTQTFNLPFASLTSTGKLAASDFANFQNKISSSSLSGASVISYNSSTGVITTQGGTFGAGDYTFPNNTQTNGTSTVLNLALFGSTATSSFNSAGALTLAQALDVSSGGTGNTSYAANSLLYFDGTKIAATSSNALYVGSLVATTSTATSTFNGGLAVANSLFVLQNGNIGVGNSTPTKTLDITGTARISSTFTLGGTVSCVGGNALQTDSQGNIVCGGVTATGATTGGGWTTNNIGLITLATTTDRVAVGATSTPYAKLTVISGSAGTTTLALLPASGATANILDIYDTTGALASVFTAQNFFGIGTTSPSAKLSVQGNGLFSGNVNATNITANGTLSAGGTTLVTTGAGHVGIGTSTPASLLSVAGGNITQTAAGNPTIATTVPESGSTHAFGTFVSGRYEYVADYEGGLRIFDVSNPQNPIPVGSNSSYTGSPKARNVVVSGKFAYVADEGAGLKIFDVSQTNSPTLVGGYALTGSAYSLAVSGRYVYIVDSTNHATRIIDVSNPASPVLAGTFTSTAPQGVAVQGKYLYVTDFTPAFYVVDVSNPAAPVQVGVYNNAAVISSPLSIYISGSYAFVADEDSGMLAINIANPASPALAGRYPASGFGHPYTSVVAAGTNAYVTDHSGNTVVVDISNISSPKLVGSIASAGTPNGLYVSGKYAYIADNDQGVDTVDLNGTTLPAANIGALSSSIADISDNLNVGGDIYVGGGINAGISGIFTRGGLSVLGTTTLQAPLTVNASSTVTGVLTAFGGANFGSLTANNGVITNATSTNFFATLASTTNLTISSVQGSLLKTNASGGVVAAVAGTDYITGAGLAAAFPFTPTTFGSTNANATSTLIGFTQGIYALASSTIGDGTQTGGLTISGGATTTGNAYFGSTISAAGNLLFTSSSATIKVADSAGAGNALNITGSNAAGSSNIGGNVFLTAGAGASSGSFGGTGGAVVLAGGAGGTGTFTGQPGGLVQLIGGASGVNSFSTGFGTPAFLTVTGGGPSSPGAAFLSAGNSTAGGGTLALTGGDATSTGGGGTIFLTAGVASSSTNNATGGNLTFAAGAASSTNSTVSGGSITLTAGSGGSGVLTNGSGGNVTLNGGAAGVTGGSVGNVLLATLRGNVGIGTTSPFATLSVNGSGYFGGALTASIINATTSAVLASTTLTGNSLFSFATTTSFAITGVTSSLLKTDASGNVQAAVPGTDYVTGASLAAAFPFTPTTFGSSAANATSTLIGFTQGIYALASSTIGDGTQTGGLTISGGATSTLGFNSLATNLLSYQGSTTISVLGTNNFFAGQGANASTTKFNGHDNVFIGTEAGYAANTNFSTYIGSQSGAGSTTGTQNSGTNNTAVGAQTLQFNSTGNLDSAFGTFALQNNTTGVVNNAFGYNSLALNTIGSNNNAFGGQALGSNTSGNGNNAFGLSSLLSNTTGTNNSAFGYQAGRSVSTGYSNTLIGDNTTINSVITTGGGNVGLGSNIFFPSATANSQLNIGNLIYGTLPATTTGFALPTSGKLGIGTSSPFAKFAIQTNNGDTATTLFAIGSSTQSATTTLFSVSNTGTAYFAGNVGVKTQTPGSALDVAGFINTDQFSGYKLGGNLLGYASSTSHATIFGLFAGGQNATTSSSLNDLVAIGYQALNADTIGTVNTAVGSGALQSDTTGGGNTGLGYFALNSNLSGTTNTALGESALQFEGGSSNAALGAFAGYGGTGFSNTGSVYVGYTAGFSASNGSNYNTFVGYQSGINVTTGYGNTLLGSAPTAGNLTTGNGNIGIGNNTFFPSATGNNQINIGGILFGTLPATTTAFALPTSGSLGVGTSSPFAKFAIQSNNGDTATTLFAIGSSTQSATSTLFSVSNIGSTTLYQLNSSLLKTNANGTIVAAVAGVDYDAAGAAAASFPFTPTTAFGTAANATSTLIGFTNGLYATASSTFTSTLAVVGQAIFNSNVGIGTSSPYAALSVNGTTTSTGGFNVDGNANLLSYLGSPVISIPGTNNFYAGPSVNGSTTKTSFGVNNNVYVGAQAGFGATGSQNIYIGSQSGAGPVSGAPNTGGLNTAVGVSTLSANTSGSNNSAFGRDALQTNSSGTGNSAFGLNALQLNTTGTNNNIFGVFEGKSITTGYSNTLIGDNSNAGNQITTGGGNIGLGSDVFFPSATGNSQLNIGNLIYGSIPATTTGFALPTTGKLGIGTSSPFAKFAIQSNNGDTATTLFAIGSSTQSATTTLFSISNTGTIQTSLGSGFVGSNNGVLYNFASSTLTAASSTLLSDSNTFSGVNTFTGNTTFTNATSSTFAITGIASGNILKTTTGGSIIAAVAGTDYITGAGLAAAFPFTPTTAFGTAANSTSTLIGFTNGLYALASSTIGNGTQAGGLTINGGATTTGSLNILGINGLQINGVTGVTGSSTKNNFDFGGATSSLVNAGSFNYAIGYGALGNATSSLLTGNFAVGQFALQGSATAQNQGTNNNALGNSALTSNTTGINNNALGLNSLSNNTIGNGNNAFGSNALTNNTTGGFNNAFGASALASNTTGSNNTAIGLTALFFNTTGSNNIGIGANAGRSITSGYSNIVLGDNSSNGTTVTSGFGNIFIGPNTFGQSATANLQLNIGSLIFGTLPATTTAFRLPTSGSIGIGTSSPFAKFAIQTNNGDTATTLFAIGSSTQSATTTLFSIDNTGLISINGTTSIAVDTTNRNAFFGIAVNGSTTISHGSDNVFVGNDAGLAVTGNSSVYIGSFSGVGSTTGAQNSAGGNTAVGYKTLQVNSTGSLNSAFGSQSLSGNTTGTNNSAFGYQSLLRNTTGTENAAVGLGALSFNVSGGKNVALGNNANFFSASNKTVAVGYSAGGTGGSALGFTLLGYEAGFNNTDGADYNTLIGYQSGSSITTGYGNTLLGSASNAGNLTSGNGNIGIGYNTFFPSAAGNNQINIGGLLFGSLPATTTSFQLPTSGALGVGTSSPFAKFAIQSNNGDTATTLFAIGSSTQSATTTLFSVSNTGNSALSGTASSTNVIVSSLGANAGQCVTVTATGQLTTQSCATGGAGFPFTPDTSFAAAANSTSTLIGFTNGLYATASSTFTSSLTALATSTFFGNVGIGTSSPYTNFAFVGADNTNAATSFLVQSGSGTGPGVFGSDIKFITGNTASASTAGSFNVTTGNGGAFGTSNGGTINLTTGYGGLIGGTIALTTGPGAFQGGAINLTTGAATSTGNGGDFNFNGGNATSSGTGGNFIFTGGNGGPSLNSTGNGGSVTLNGGAAGLGGGKVGNILLATVRGNVGIGTTSPFATLSVQGVSSATAGTAAPTAFSVLGGAGSTTGNGGAIALTAGNGGTSGTGGALTLTGGVSTVANAAAASSISIAGGSQTLAGNLSFTGGAGSANGGNFTFTGGAGFAGAGGGFAVNAGAGLTGGAINLTTGSGSLGAGNFNFNGGAATSTGNGGSFTFNGGIASSSSGTGGGFTVTGGAASSTVSSVGGGAITLTGGSGGTGTQTNGSGGNVTLNGGAAGVTGGSVGNVLLATLRGNVGIGTTSPFATLSVNGSGYFGGALTASIINATTSAVLASTTLTGNSLFSFATTTSFAITGVTSSLLKTDASGNVQAAVPGTDYLTPSALASAFPFTPTTAFGTAANATSTLIGFTNGLYATASSTIGNGTQAGGLTINGGATTTGSINILSSNGLLINSVTGVIGSTTTNNFDFGGATSSLVNAGTFNYAIGYGALGNTTGAGNNFAVGQFALQGSTSVVDTGSSNVAIGNSALRSNATGASNNAFGQFALLANMSGSFNNALGFEALQNNITGGSNNAFGDVALQNNTSGSKNNAFGPSTLRNNTTGSNNNSLGFQALFSNTTGNGNSAFGSSALQNNTTGSNNFAVGSLAGFNISTGYSNILLGDNTTFTAAAGNITTGFGNIGIGPNALFPSSTANQQLNIGNLIYGSLPATTTAFQLPTSGSLGVGTSSPFAKFAIQTNNGDTATTLFAIGSSTQSATSTLFSISNTGNSALSGTASSTNVIASALGANAGQCVTVTATGQLTTQSCATGGSGFPFTPDTSFAAAANSTSTLIGFTNGLYATASSTFTSTLAVVGNAVFNSTVGIGTSSPANSAAFGVVGNSYFNGNVGIGIANSPYALHALVSTTSANAIPTDVAALEVHASSGSIPVGAGPSLLFKDAGASVNFMARIAAVYEKSGINQLSGLAFYTNATPGSPSADNLVERLRLTDFGNLGLGTTTPFGKFAISLNSTDAAYPNNNAFIIASSTASATSTLFSISNTGTATAIAFNATTTNQVTTGYYINGVTGVIGSTTLNNFSFGGATSTLNQGTFNYAIGYGALANASSSNGNNNFAVGQFALQGSTTVQNQGHDNNALGAFALSGNTTGNGNNAFGPFALTKNTTGSSNNVLGNGLGNNTTGSNNNALGPNVLNSNTTGSNNNAFGSQNLQLNTTGSNNNAIGFNVLLFNTTGSNNTGLGANSLIFETTGTNNTGIGFNAGSSITSGYSNLMLGDNSQFNSGITTGSGNIGLGSNIFFPSATGNQQLNIGNLVFGTLPATTTAFQLPTSGSLGIGTSSPFAKFAIQTNNGDTATTLFAIGSSTQSATSTLFSISNTGNSALAGTASSTNVIVSSLGSNAGQCVTVTATGQLTTQSCATGGTAYPFPNIVAGANATSSLVGFTGGILATASSTIGDGTQAGGLTVSGGATTTGSLNILGINGLQINGVTGVTGSSTLNNFSFGGATSTNNKGSFNYAIGYGALANATSSLIFNNFAVGQFALQGSANLQNTGSNNNALGSTALANNTTGSDNNSFGSGTLNRNTSGSSNNALGNGALLFNSTGSNNNALGFEALFNNTTGSGNTAIGFISLSVAQSSNNTAVGYQEGVSITTGYSNTLIGNNNTQNTTLTTGSANIGLGSDIFFPAVTGNSQLNIGNLIYGALPATSTKFQLPTSGKIGIGTSSPFAKFAIQSNNGDTATTLFAIGSSTASATTTLFNIDNQGNTTAAGTASSTNVIASALGANAGQCVTVTSTGQLTTTSCGTGGGSFPFTPTTFGATAANSTSTLIGFTNGIYALASSTIGDGTQAGGLTINGGATTTGSASVTGSLTVGGSVTTGTIFASSLINTSCNLTVRGGGSGLSWIFCDNNFIAPGASPTSFSKISAGYYSADVNAGTLLVQGQSAWDVSTNKNGGNLNLAGGLPSGTGAPGNVILGVDDTHVLGNVGIATTSPFGKLAILLNSTDSSFYNNAFIIASSTASATSTLFSVSNIGKVTVGPGTGSMVGTNEQLVNNQNGAAGIAVHNSSAGNETALFAGGNGDGSVGSISNNDFKILTNNTEVARFTSSGNFGVSSSSPFAKLAVQARATDTATVLFAIGSSTASATTTLFSVSNTGSTTIAGPIGVTSTATSTFAAGINISSGCFSVNNTCVGSGGGGGSVTGTTGQVAFLSGTNTAAGTSSLFIAPTGNVGVGTSTPYSKLTVWGADSATSTYALLVANSASTTEFAVNDTGTGFFNTALGIGTTTPTGLLSITTSGSTQPSIYVGSATAGTQFVVTAAGNVGIGTSSPSSILSVANPTSNAQFSLAYDQTRYATMQVDATGNLNIHTSNGGVTGGGVTLSNDNLWVCQSGSCPTTTATSTAGNLFVENAVVIGDGFSVKEINSTDLGLYGADGALMVTFDHGN